MPVGEAEEEEEEAVSEVAAATCRAEPLIAADGSGRCTHDHARPSVSLVVRRDVMRRRAQSTAAEQSRDELKDEAEECENGPGQEQKAAEWEGTQLRAVSSGGCIDDALSSAGWAVLSPAAPQLRCPLYPSLLPSHLTTMGVVKLLMQ